LIGWSVAFQLGTHLLAGFGRKEKPRHVHVAMPVCRKLDLLKGGKESFGPTSSLWDRHLVDSAYNPGPPVCAAVYIL
jgi:hypothetical protein